MYKAGLLETSPTTRLLCLFSFDKQTFEVDALQNSNMFTETKSGNAKIKTNDMNNDDRNDATNQPVSLNNEDTPDAAIFVRATPAPSLFKYD